MATRNVTVVDGTELTGYYAPDGSINVVVVPEGSTRPVGIMHPCGALNVTSNNENTPCGYYAPDGSMNVTDQDKNNGATKVNVVSGSLASWVATTITGDKVLFDADYENTRFYFGQEYTDETAFNTAAGGTKSGTTRTFGPYIDPTNTNLLPDQAAANWFTQAGMTVTDETGGVKLTSAGTGSLPVATLTIAQAALAVKFAGTGKRDTGTGNINVFGSGTSPGLGDPTTGPAFGSSAAPFSLLVGGGAACYLGFRNSSTAGTGDAHADSLSAVAVWPLKGWVQGSNTVYVEFTTPATMSAAEAIVFIGGNDVNITRARHRLELSSSYALTFTGAFGAAASATLSLGTLSASTRYRVAITGQNNDYSASLEGADCVTDNMATIPGLAKLWIGASQAGETFTGTIHRVSITNGRQANEWLQLKASGGNALWTEGDSYMGTVDGGNLGDDIASSASRSVANSAVGGSTMDDILTRVQARPYLANQTFVLWDGSPNSYGDAVSYCNKIQQVFDCLNHKRFVLILTGCPYGTNSAATAVIWDEMIRRWPNNVLDWKDYIPNTNGAMNQDQTDVDGIHPTAAARLLLSPGVADFISNKGW